MPQSSLRLRDEDPDAVRLGDAHLSMAWHFAALLLGSPDEVLVSRLESVHRASHLLPDEVGGPLRTTVVHLERAPLAQLRTEYAETFAHGADVVARVCTLLERAANAEARHGRAMLTEERSLLESLHRALAHRESGWTGAVAAVIATFPRAARRPVTR